MHRTRPGRMRHPSPRQGTPPAPSGVIRHMNCQQPVSPTRLGRNERHNGSNARARTSSVQAFADSAVSSALRQSHTPDATESLRAPSKIMREPALFP